MPHKSGVPAEELGLEANDPAELATMHIQAVLGRIAGAERLRDLATTDREMLDLTLGILFHFDPK